MYTLLDLSSTNKLPLKNSVTWSWRRIRSLSLYTTMYGNVKSALSLIDRSSKDHMIKFSVIGKYRGKRLKLYDRSRHNPENGMTLLDIYEKCESVLDDLF